MSNSSFSRDARWSVGIFVSKSVGSLAFVVVASKRLGGDVFGTLAALSALTSIASVFVTNGLGHVVTMKSSRSGAGCGPLLAAAVRMALILAAAVTPLYLMASVWLVGASLVAAVALFVADVVVGGSAEVVGSALIGCKRFKSATWVLAAPGVARLGAATIIVLGTGDDLTELTVIVALVSLAALPWAFAAGRALWTGGGQPERARDLARASGVFVLGNVITRLNNDFDKLILPVQLGAVSSVGSYALGYRLVEYSLLPLLALSTAAYPRLFRAGTGGALAALDAARRMSKFYIGAGLLLAFSLWMIRGKLVWIFGDSYVELATVIGLLSLYPLLRSLTNLFGEPLTGAGQHRYRVAVGACAVAVNVAVNVAFIGAWGWKASVVATYAAETVQLLLLLIIWRRRVTAQRVLTPLEAPVAV